MLPAESRAVPRVDAGTDLRTGRKRRDLRQSLRLERAHRSRSADTPIDCRLKSEMPWGGRRRISVSANADVRGTIKLRIPGWARNRPAPGGLYSYANADRSTSRRSSVNGQARRRVSDDAWLRDARPRLERRRRRRRSSFRWTSPDRRRRQRASDARPRGHRARADRLLRGVARRRRAAACSTSSFDTTARDDRRSPRRSWSGATAHSRDTRGAWASRQRIQSGDA